MFFRKLLQKSHPEKQYLHLIKQTITNGTTEIGRNGKTRVLIGASMRFSLENNTVPLLTTKKVAWKTCLNELLWFIRGETSNSILQKNNVHIWNDNASRDFLDSQGLTTLKENDLGPIYGHQWRFFDAPYESCDDNYQNQGIDQLQYIIDQLKNKSNSRRLILTAWNPKQINQMALPPCHTLSQFHVTNGNELSCTLYQRSGDLGLGIPFNIASYSFLTHVLANHCGLIAKEFIHFIGNVHVYDEHIEALKFQINRRPRAFPTLSIKNIHNNINDYVIEDFEINNYIPKSKIIMKMRK